jgi:hypothetical protein
MALSYEFRKQLKEQLNKQKSDYDEQILDVNAQLKTKSLTMMNKFFMLMLS